MSPRLERNGCLVYGIISVSSVLDEKQDQSDEGCQYGHHIQQGFCLGVEAGFLCPDDGVNHHNHVQKKKQGEFCRWRHGIWVLSFIKIQICWIVYFYSLQCRSKRALRFVH